MFGLVRSAIGSAWRKGKARMIKMSEKKDVNNTGAPCGKEGQAGNFGLPQRLRRMRKQERMSQTLLSQCCGLGKNAVSDYEAGQKLPSVASLVRLADFFGVSTDFLLGRENF